MKRVTQAFARWETLLVVLLILAGVLGTLLSPFFLSTQSLSLMLSEFMERAIVALVMTLIIVSGEIDLSVASVMGLAGAVVGVTWAAGLPLGIGIALALGVGAAAGLINGFFVTRLLLPSLVVTLATLGLYRGLASVLLGDKAVSDFPIWFTYLGFGYVPGTLLPWSSLVFAMLAILLFVILHRSWVGRQLYAVGNNEEAARFSGVRVQWIKLWLFALSGTIAALAGILFTARLSSARADNAMGFELDIIAAVLLGGVYIFGGRGSLLGVILALFLVATLRNGLALADVSSNVQIALVGALLILSVLGPNLFARVVEAVNRRRLAAEEPSGNPRESKEER